MKPFPLLLLILLGFGFECVFGALLRNVTESVFGEDPGYLPMAFGDFNSDKLTDLFVVKSENGQRSTLSVLLAKPQTFAMESGTYFNLETRTKGVKINLVTGSPVTKKTAGNKKNVLT